MNRIPIEHLTVINIKELSKDIAIDYVEDLKKLIKYYSPCELKEQIRILDHRYKFDPRTKLINSYKETRDNLVCL